MSERNITAITSATSNLENDRTNEMKESTTSENSSLLKPFDDTDITFFIKELNYTSLVASVIGSTVPTAIPINTIVITSPFK